MEHNQTANGSALCQSTVPSEIFKKINFKIGSEWSGKEEYQEESPSSKEKVDTTKTTEEQSLGTTQKQQTIELEQQTAISSTTKIVKGSIRSEVHVQCTCGSKKKQRLENSCLQMWEKAWRIDSRTGKTGSCFHRERLLNHSITRTTSTYLTSPMRPTPWHIIKLEMGHYHARRLPRLHTERSRLHKHQTEQIEGCVDHWGKARSTQESTVHQRALKGRLAKLGRPNECRTLWRMRDTINHVNYVNSCIPGRLKIRVTRERRFAGNAAYRVSFGNTCCQRT